MSEKWDCQTPWNNSSLSRYGIHRAYHETHNKNRQNLFLWVGAKHKTAVSLCSPAGGRIVIEFIPTSIWWCDFTNSLIQSFIDSSSQFSYAAATPVQSTPCSSIHRAKTAFSDSCYHRTLLLQHIFSSTIPFRLSAKLLCQLQIHLFAIHVFRKTVFHRRKTAFPAVQRLWYQEFKNHTPAFK